MVDSEKYEYLVRGQLGIMACRSGKHFADKVVKRLHEIICDKAARSNRIAVSSTEQVFANSEIKTEIDESIRNRDIYIFQDVENNADGMSVNDNFMALKTAIIAAKSSDARFITAVVPVFPYARQDKSKSREGITASMVCRELEEAGATRVITLDIHQEASYGFFRKAVLENLRASKKFMDYIYENIPLDNLVIVAPDAGSAQRSSFYARKLRIPFAILHKERDYSSVNVVDKMTLVGDVKGKDCFFIDDMIDTGGTTLTAMKAVKEQGAKNVYFATSLPLFNGKAIEKLGDAFRDGIFTKIIGTNVVYHGEWFAGQNPWYDEVKIENYFARVIYNINQGISISKLLE
ncbi:MAG: ribose-phosphate diphosphokinase [Nanoarchaeota archaeon]